MEPIAITAEQARKFDQYTIEKIGVPSMVLMEHAAMAVTDRLVHSHNFDLANVLVVAAPGNNGGDGIAIARLLHLQNVPVTVVLLGNREQATEQTAQQLSIVENYGIHVLTEMPSLNDFTTFIDAIFGIGLARDVASDFAKAIETMNASSAEIMAVDIPSGIDTDTGQTMGVSIQATETVTMGYNKTGLLTKAGQAAAGIVTVADIGIYDPASLPVNH